MPILCTNCKGILQCRNTGRKEIFPSLRHDPLCREREIEALGIRVRATHCTRSGISGLPDDGVETWIQWLLIWLNFAEGESLVVRPACVSLVNGLEEWAVRGQ